MNEIEPVVNDLVEMTKLCYEKDKQIDSYKREIERLKSLWETDKQSWNELMAEEEIKIERLNNIIDKAKIYCEDVIQEHENGEYDVDTVWLANKEHKGNIKSVLNILNGDLENYWRGDKE